MDVEFKENYSVKKLTSFKIGGEVDKIYFPKTQQEFVYLLQSLDNPIIFGNWSNVLISSDGIKGNVISTSELNKFEIKGKKVIADCGAKGQTLSKKVSDASLTGLEFLIGIPGTIGGAVYMNAGAHSQSISDCLVSVCVFDMDKKEVLVLEKKDLGFDYRTSVLQKKPYILLSAEFDLKKADKSQIEALLNRNLEFRKTRQPNLATPNCGSVFKNPENDSAGRLLDKAGVKGFEIGGVKVWENHANFIINTGEATSQDVLELMLKMYNEVNDKYTIQLHPEVKYFGKKSKREEEICEILYSQK